MLGRYASRKGCNVNDDDPGKLPKKLPRRRNLPANFEDVQFSGFKRTIPLYLEIYALLQDGRRRYGKGLLFNSRKTQKKVQLKTINCWPAFVFAILPRKEEYLLYLEPACVKFNSAQRML